MKIFFAAVIIAAICFFIVLIGKKGKKVKWDGGCAGCQNTACKNCHPKE